MSILSLFICQEKATRQTGWSFFAAKMSMPTEKRSSKRNVTFNKKAKNCSCSFRQIVRSNKMENDIKE